MTSKKIIDNETLMKEWDFSKNVELNPEKISCGSGKKAWWICSKCNHNWQTQIYLRKKHGCPNCAHKKVGEKNSIVNNRNKALDVVFPEVTKVWNYEKNKNLDPSDFMPKSNRVVWWKCSLCGKEWQSAVYAKSHTTICKECNYKNSNRTYVKNGINDLATKCPHLINEWDYKKNKIKPNEISFSSSKKVWWICDKGHSFENSPLNRTKHVTSQCPFCSNRKLLSGYNDIATVCPELLKEWDYSKNKIEPNKVIKGSHIKFYWTCEKGHSYESSVANRIKGKGCPFCASQKVLKGFNDLKSQHPEFVKEWNYNKNCILPDEVTSKSGKIVWWICNKGHEWKSSVVNRTRNGGKGCPICANRVVLPGYNDFATTNSEMLREWDYKKNKIKPNEIIPGSVKKVWWICDKGHSWNASIVSRVKNHFCPVCNSSKQTSISEKCLVYYLRKSKFEIIENYKINRRELDIFIPELNIGIEYDGQYYHRSAQADLSKNKLCKELGIMLIRVREPGLPILKSTSKDFIIDTLTSDHTYMNNIIKRLLKFLKIENIDVDVERDFDKIYSLFQKGERKDSIALSFPSLLEEWDYLKNSIQPEQVSKGSHLSVWWKCKKCNYSWSSKVYTRCNGSGCPNCAGMINRKKPSKLIIGVNDFETMYPGLLKEWDYNKNTFKPAQITCGSNEKIWWICDKGHSYDASITNRLKGTACPYCVNKKVLKGYNDLSTTNPEIAKEWDYEKNGVMKPDDFTIGSGKRVWWKCSLCGKEWQSIIYTRKSGPYCGQCKRKNYNSGKKSLN